MKLLRYHPEPAAAAAWGLLQEETIFTLEGDPLGTPRPGTRVGELEAHRLAAPCRPGKVIALGINYRGITGAREGMAEPVVFLKSGTGVCGPRDDVLCPFPEVRVWGEPELALVLGRRLHRADRAAAAAAILGYTVANDVTAENVEGRDHHLARSKAADTFCPLGPWIDTAYDPVHRTIRGRHNDTLLREGSTDERIWDDAATLAWLSSWMTLEPWDVVLTGTPPRVRDRLYLEEGDLFVCEIEGLGQLRNHFRRAGTAPAPA